MLTTQSSDVASDKTSFTVSLSLTAKRPLVSVFSITRVLHRHSFLTLAWVMISSGCHYICLIHYCSSLNTNFLSSGNQQFIVTKQWKDKCKTDRVNLFL